MQYNYSIRNLRLTGYNPVTVGYERCESSHAFGPTTRTYMLIHYVASGKGIFVRGEKTYELSKGMCFVIRPGEVTYYKADAAEPWHYIWIGFTAREQPSCLLRDVLDASAAGDIFCEIEDKRELYNSEYGDGGVREAYCCGRIGEILARLEIANSSQWTAENSEMDIVKNFIDTSYANDIKISALAEQFHFENSYFSRAFKKRFGVSPQSYLVEKRLSEAALLMTVYGFTPSAAANAVGYGDIYLFSKMFRRRYGVSPRNYVITFL